ncbi:hypothetical protein BD410DRAFT_709455 [Rickenella mellea]|uniref:N-acetyltransferase domain-containing protein n=1 Tax=Rickenella mellea TaxID=50990 RepID=A0A4R5XFQ0_9AGAM|nr:hypothetical protein BD410DRAFT_709455 [Rickenella mellea]
MSSERAFIRPATSDDITFLSHICLVTGDKGNSAEHLYTIGSLLGLVYAVPYVQPELASHTFGFVIEERESKNVVGYILGATDTRAYEAAAAVSWWPRLREEYPLSLVEGYEEAATDDATHHDDSARLTPDDVQIIRTIHSPPPAEERCIAFSPAHMHIDILPQYQRQGWGRRLIGTVVAHLREKGLNGLWLAMAPGNDNAAKFYARLGYERFEDELPWTVGLRFDTWKE